MAEDYFLKIDGIDGESQDKTHGNEIEINSISFGVSQTGGMGYGGGGGVGKAAFQDISFSKRTDKATCKIMEACAKGTHIKEIVFTARKAGDKPLEYIKITMKEVIVTSVSTGGSGGEDRLTENVTLNFAQVKFDYTPQDSKGTVAGDKTFAWHIAENHEA